MILARLIQPSAFQSLSIRRTTHDDVAVKGHCCVASVERLKRTDPLLSNHDDAYAYSVYHQAV